MRVYVGHVAPGVTIDDLYQLVAPHGRVAHISLKLGFGFVDFVDAEAADAAIKALNRTYARIGGCSPGEAVF